MIVAPCNVVETYRRFRGTQFLYHEGDLMMEAGITPETSVKFSFIIREIASETSMNFYETARHNNPEDSHLRSICSLTDLALNFQYKIMKITAV
jgi:hypothetical protein